jgi:hypothetical protein
MQKIIGYITWDSNPPEGISFQTHKFSFTDAITMASMKFPPEEIVGPQFIITGDSGAMILSTLPMTNLRKSKPDGSMFSANIKDEPNIFVLGSLARWKILYDTSPEMGDKILVVCPKADGNDKAVEITVVGKLADVKWRPAQPESPQPELVPAPSPAETPHAPAST